MKNYIKGMNLAVDIGNSSVKLGYFLDGNLFQFIIKETLDEAVEYININKPQNIIFSSVAQVPEKIFSYLDKEIKIFVLDAKLPVPIINKYKNPETLGADRLAAATGASYLYPYKNCLSIDIGTCITFDLINDKGEYLGGSISPGVTMRFKALHTFTARLPLFEAVRDTAFIGKTTEESILSGVMNGTLAEIEKMIYNFQNIFPNLQVIICGGDAKFFESRIKASIFVVPELVLIGLNRILEHNV